MIENDSTSSVQIPNNRTKQISIEFGYENSLFLTKSLIAGRRHRCTIVGQILIRIVVVPVARNHDANGQIALAGSGIGQVVGGAADAGRWIGDEHFGAFLQTTFLFLDAIGQIDLE